MMRAVLLLSILGLASAIGPIQQVLGLLADLKQKVIADGEVEAAQYKEYEKWCASESQGKAYEIETGTNKVADLNALGEELTSQIGQLTAQIQDLSTSVSKNDRDLQEATNIRNKQKAEFTKTDADLTETIDTLIRAASVLTRAGLGGSAGSAAKLKGALTQVAATLSTVMDSAFINIDDRRHLSSLLEASSSEEEPVNPQAAVYDNHSTSIIDLLAELKMKAEQERSDLRKSEMNNQHNFDMLAQSLNDQIATEEKDLSDSTSARNAAQESAGQAQGDLATASKTLASDKEYKSSVDSQCQTKAAEWDSRQESRKAELEALQKATDILSADNFSAAAQRRLPGEAFVQLSSSRNNIDVRQRVSALLQGVARNTGSVSIAQLAIRTRMGQDPFGKIRGLIEGMITKLQNQAAEEADHNSYCVSENAKSTKKRDNLSSKSEDQSSRIDKAESGVAELKNEVATLSAEMASADKSMAEATNLRQQESSEYTKAMSDYAEGQNALASAITVLQEHYSSSAALVQAPAIFEGAYEKKAAGADGIIAMLEVAASDFARMEAEAKSTESAALKAFTKMKQENEVSQAMKATASKNKESEIVRVTNLINDLKADRSGTQEELDAVLKYLSKLKQACNHKPQTFEERAASRQQEIEGLKTALDILDGVNASFLQKA